MKKEDLIIELMTMTDISELRMIRSAISDRIKEVGSAVKYELKNSGFFHRHIFRGISGSRCIFNPILSVKYAHGHGSGRIDRNGIGHATYNSPHALCRRI